MRDITLNNVAELSAEEAGQVEGGTLPLATFFISCFGAGFKFGFDVVGPMIVG